MKKLFKQYTIWWIIALALFNVAAFAFPQKIDGIHVYTIGFWVGYGMITAAFLWQLVIANTAFASGTLNALFLNLPLLTISKATLIFAVIAGAVCMILPGFMWIGVVICLAAALFGNIALAKAAAAAQIIEGIDLRVQNDTQFIRSLTADAEGLLSRAADATSTKRIYEAIRYSDPVSSESMRGIENKIAVLYAEYKKAILAGENEFAAEAERSLLPVIEERNRQCRLAKTQSRPAAESATRKPAFRLPFALIAIVVIVTVALCMFFGLAVPTMQKSTICENAEQMINAEKYEEAIVELNKVGDFKNAGERVMYCEKQINLRDTYLDAMSKMVKEDYEGAKKLFENAAGYKDSDALAKECETLGAIVYSYNDAVSLMESGDYAAAKKGFDAHPDYKDSTVLAEQCQRMIDAEANYAAALKLYNDAQYAEAFKLFEQLGDYESSAAMCEEIKKHWSTLVKEAVSAEYLLTELSAKEGNAWAEVDKAQIAASAKISYDEELYAGTVFSFAWTFTYTYGEEEYACKVNVGGEIGVPAYTLTFTQA